MEHSVNDNGKLKHWHNSRNKYLEQLLRVVLAKNKKIVVILPEITTRIVTKLWNEKYKMEACYLFNNSFQSNIDLAKFYHLQAVVQFVHIPCSQYHIFLTELTSTQRFELATMYHPFRQNSTKKLDFHPSAMVHGMIAEFILFYFRTSIMDLIETNFSSVLTFDPTFPKAPLYSNSKLFDCDYNFKCFIEIQEPNIFKNDISPNIVANADNFIRIEHLGSNNTFFGELHGESTFKFNNLNLKPSTKLNEKRCFEIAISVACGVQKMQRINASVLGFFEFSYSKGYYWFVGPIAYNLQSEMSQLQVINIHKLKPLNNQSDSFSQLWFCDRSVTLQSLSLNFEKINVPLKIVSFIIELHEFAIES